MIVGVDDDRRRGAIEVERDSCRGPLDGNNFVTLRAVFIDQPQRDGQLERGFALIDGRLQRVALLRPDRPACTEARCAAATDPLAHEPIQLHPALPLEDGLQRLPVDVFAGVFGREPPHGRPEVLLADFAGQHVEHHGPLVVADLPAGAAFAPIGAQRPVILGFEIAERDAGVTPVIARPVLVAVENVSIVIRGVTRQRLAPVAIRRVNVDAVAPVRMQYFVVEVAVHERPRPHLEQPAVEQRELRKGEPGTEEVLDNGKPLERKRADQGRITRQVGRGRVEEEVRVPLDHRPGVGVRRQRVVQRDVDIADLFFLYQVRAADQRQTVQRVAVFPHELPGEGGFLHVQRRTGHQLHPDHGLGGEAIVGQFAARGLLRFMVEGGVPSAAGIEIEAFRADVGRHQEVVDLAGPFSGLHVLHEDAGVIERQGECLGRGVQRDAVGDQEGRRAGLIVGIRRVGFEQRVPAHMRPVRGDVLDRQGPVQREVHVQRLAAGPACRALQGQRGAADEPVRGRVELHLDVVGRRLDRRLGGPNRRAAGRHGQAAARRQEADETEGSHSGRD